MCVRICVGSHMNHLAAEWRESGGVGGREDGRPDLAADSVNGVITAIPPSVQHKQEVTNGAALALASSFSSSIHLSPLCVNFRLFFPLPFVCLFVCFFLGCN